MPQYTSYGSDPYDRLNPVTGRSYNEGFANAPGNPLNSLYSPNRPRYQRPKQINPELERARENVYQGSDFSQYQNQLNQLLQNPSSIENDPSYQFRLGQGRQAIDRSAAARGMGASGNVLSELAKYGQGMASEEYGNQFNRLRDLMRGSQQFGLEAGYYKPRRENLPFGTVDTSPSWY